MASGDLRGFKPVLSVNVRRWDSGVGCVTSDFGDGTIRRT